MTIRCSTACIAVCVCIISAACGGAGENQPAQTRAIDQPASARPTESAAGTPGAPASSLPDPCRLLTDEEIRDVLRTSNAYTVSGRTFMPFPDVGGGRCDIEVKNPDGFTSSFAISVSPELKGSLFIEPGTRNPIEGLGPEAFGVRFNYYAITKGVLLHVVNVPGERASGAAAFLRIAMAKL